MMQPYFETHPLRGIPRGRTILRGGKTNLKPIWWTYYPGFLIQGLLGMGPKKVRPKKNRPWMILNDIFWAFLDYQPINLPLIWVNSGRGRPHHDGRPTQLRCLCHRLPGVKCWWTYPPHLAWVIPIDWNTVVFFGWVEPMKHSASIGPGHLRPRWWLTFTRQSVAVIMTHDDAYITIVSANYNIY